MHILYISALASQAAIEDARCRDKTFRGYAIQKFSRLLAEGLAENHCVVTALSTFYLPRVGHGYRRKTEQSGGVTYKYVSSPNFRPLRYAWLIIVCFFYVLFFGLKHSKDKVIICDALNVSACLGALAAAWCTGLRCVGLVTDMPGLIVGNNTGNEKVSFAARVNKRYLSHFSHYVFMTELANEVINVFKRPYIIMEGLVDGRMEVSRKEVCDGKRVVMYAGGLMERYGLRMLVDGFIKADVENSELWLFGSGSFSHELCDYERKDPRIRYFGIRPNQEVVEAELKATLLVNPRPTHEEFTKYSFPSKNLEYMVSGTAVLTTRLPGMPKEYYPFVYLFDAENSDAYSTVLRHILNLPIEELNSKGKKAREWVLENKNHIKQSRRVVSLLENQ